MQAAKNIIKIQLNHYNHILPVAPTSHNTLISVPENIVKAEANREKEEKRDGKDSRIQYIAADSEQLHEISEFQTKNEDDNEDFQLTYKLILSNASWHCPCGKQIYGPIQFFLHIKEKHEYDTLQKIIQQKTLKKMFECYPSVHKNQLQIIEQLDKISFQQSLKELASKYNPFPSGGGCGLEGQRQRGSFLDMAVQFIQSICDDNAKLMMKLFFSFLQEFVNGQLGKDAWSQQSPKDLLKYSNQIFNYFHERQVRERYRPFREQDTKRIIYIVSKWMFVNRWTNDRIFNNLPPSPDLLDSQCEDLDAERIQQKKQNEDHLH